MRIYGLDFTSAPNRRKPLTVVSCTLEGETLRVASAETLVDFRGFEGFLSRPDAWVCGMDFPFGQPRSLVAALGWPASWEGYVGEISRLTKNQFEDAIRGDMAGRSAGNKYRYRGTDRRAGSSSAMMLFRVPVGKMFYQGAPRLLASGVSVEPCRPRPDARVAVEAYPALVVRALLGKTSYKSDERAKQTEARRAVREALVAALESKALRERYGFAVSMDDSWRTAFIRDPAADSLDSLLCAVQAAWAARSAGYGVPEGCDRDEGWICDPATL